MAYPYQHFHGPAWRAFLATLPQGAEAAIEPAIHLRVLGGDIFVNVTHPAWTAAVTAAAAASPNRPPPAGHWGPPLWAEMETRAAAGTMDAGYLTSVAARLPCGPCSTHFAAYRQAHPLPTDPADQPRWLRSLHNAVNVLRKIDPWPEI